MRRAIPHLQVFDFLGEDEYATLLDHVAAHAESTVASTVVDPSTYGAALDEGFRRSRVDPEVELIWPPLEDRLRALLPHLRRELGVPHFALGSIERQLTLHGDGDFFSRHLDENHPGTDQCRMITFVFYFNAEPRTFEGGELRLYDSIEDAHGVRQPADEYTEIAPVANSIVFFPADAYHEVVPVRATGDGPGALRCTVNGWYRAGDLGRPSVPELDPGLLALVAARALPRVGARGFGVRPTPEDVHGLLEARWEVGSDEIRAEGAHPAYFPDGDPDFLAMGPIGDEILHHLAPLHEEWAGVELRPVAAYGMRVYRPGQRVAMHIEHPETHIVSSMLVVAQDVDAPWPLHLDLGERRHTLFVQPGQMCFYEGASCPHGHLTGLQGRHYVVALLHYCPIHWAHSTESLVRAAIADGTIDTSGRLLPVLRADPRWRAVSEAAGDPPSGSPAPA